MNTYNIGIIGHTGVVGSAMYRYFKKRVSIVYGHSKDTRKNYPNSTIDEINRNTNIVFVAVPTAYDGTSAGHNYSILESVLAQLTDNLVIIKSTVVPTTTEILQRKYPRLSLIFNPEFLSDKTAYADFTHPDRQIIGITNRSKKQAKLVLRLLPKAPYSCIVSATEAELIKYAATLYGALKIIYANQLYDLSTATNSRYEVVVKAFTKSKWLKTEHAGQYLSIFHHGYRGYGGKCFPKDIAALLAFAKNRSLNLELFNTMDKLNSQLLRKKK